MIRGDVHAIVLPRRRGHVQHGRRYGVMCEMVGVVDARVLGTRVGHLAFDGLTRVEEALTLVLELN